MTDGKVPTKEEIIAGLRAEIAEADATIAKAKTALDEASLTLEYLTGERVRLKRTPKPSEGGKA